MIGFNYLGKLGQLGNQMFQVAALKGIATNRGFNFCFPNHDEVFDDGIGNKLHIELFKPFKLSRTSQLNLQAIDPDRPVVQEQGFQFNETLFNECPDWVSLYGFFQTEKYFKHIEDEIRSDFTFDAGIVDPCKEMIESVENPIALHVRRTDYVKNSANHFNLTIEYYQAALDHFDSGRNVIVFSDDSEWCHNQDIFADDRFIISENEDNRVDLCLMSMCDDFIIANSSYSWWGAWLSSNKDKKVIAPVQWFGKTGYTKDHDTKDLIPDDWIKITEGQ